MNVFAVFREGIYRHECGGVFDTIEEAVAAADLRRKAEPDDHHHYVVVPFVLNSITPCKDEQGQGMFKDGELNEPAAVYDTET